MHSSVSIIIVALLIVWSLYRRTRRTIGFQKFVKGRMFTRMTLLGVVGVLLLATGYLHPITYVYDVIGVVLGIVIAYYAIRTTSFERRNDAWFYRPNPWIGALLLVLFFGRIAYRLYEDYALFSTSRANLASQNNQLATYSHDPLTAIVLYTLIAYYVVYYTFVIRKERHLEVTDAGERPLG